MSIVSEIKKILDNRKKDFDNIEAPKELEGRLKEALDSKTKPKGIKNMRGKVIAACLIFLLIGYNFDTLAFYGKKIIGFNDVMNGTLKELNELGKGQVIDKSNIFKNGVTITLDGIMLDETQLIAFYTIKAPKGNVDEMMPRTTLTGLLGEIIPSHGRGEMNEDKTTMKFMQSFDPPHFFEKTLHLKFQLQEDGKTEEEEITFKIDREKAMGHSLKTAISRSIEVDNRKIDFDFILASPTRTVIKGSIQNIVELAKDVVTDNRIRPNELELELIANGKEVQSQSGGMSTDMKGITFHREYDTLPKDLNSLKLKLVRFSADHDINKVIELNQNLSDKEFTIHDQNIIINRIYKSDGKTLIEITTEDSTVLSRVYLLVDDEVVELNRTIKDEYEKLEDGTILHTRTLEFDGIGENYNLDIRRMTYSKNYNETIEVPIK